MGRLGLLTDIFALAWITICLDLFSLPNGSAGHNRDYDLEFVGVGIHYGLFWSSMVFLVLKSQAHWPYHYIRAIWQCLRSFHVSRTGTN